MSNEREEAARKFAEAMGWKYDGEAWDERNQFRIGTPNKYGEHPQRVRLPAPDAPLHEHLAFVGRVAEALGVRTMRFQLWDTGAATVQFASRRASGTHRDPSWAALLAATEAAKGKR